MDRKRLELRDEGGEEESDAEAAGDEARPRNRAAAVSEHQPDREYRREPDGLRREMHLATVPSASRV